ncbi:hypothetical protein [Streptomyces sp. NPDC048428]|uniref:hypothetical protein n=1 Tax=Streptomyces sp. NPDC048428 TaxID=3154503 RepID=UPI00343A32C7
MVNIVTGDDETRYTAAGARELPGGMVFREPQTGAWCVQKGSRVLPLDTDAVLAIGAGGHHPGRPPHPGTGLVRGQAPLVPATPAQAGQTGADRPARSPPPEVRARHRGGRHREHHHRGHRPDRDLRDLSDLRDLHGSGGRGCRRARPPAASPPCATGARRGAR